MNLPFVLSAIRRSESPEHEVLQLSVSSEAPTHLNSDGKEKLRQGQWLISTIVREINQLQALIVAGQWSDGHLARPPEAGRPNVNPRRECAYGCPRFRSYTKSTRPSR
jgi:hypothetical protein